MLLRPPLLCAGLALLADEDLAKCERHGLAAPVGAALLSVARGQQPQQILRLTPEQREILDHMSIVYLDDGQGGRRRRSGFTGVNVQVVNGLESTETTNGVGNLIVGYNEPGNALGDSRVGSHNVGLLF